MAQYLLSPTLTSPPSAVAFDYSHQKAGISSPGLSGWLPFRVGLSAFVTALLLAESWRAEIRAGSAVLGQRMSPVIPVSWFRLSSVSVPRRRRGEADSPSCHLTGVTFDVQMAVDPVAGTGAGEAAQPSGLEKQEPLKGGT